MASEVHKRRRWPWLLLSATLFLIALFLLNFAAYQSWLSWGPPTPQPHLRAFIALQALGAAICFFGMTLLAMSRAFLKARRFLVVWIRKPIKY
jgi:hypothetical protein